MGFKIPLEDKICVAYAFIDNYDTIRVHEDGRIKWKDGDVILKIPTDPMYQNIQHNGQWLLFYYLLKTYHSNQIQWIKDNNKNTDKIFDRIFIIEDNNLEKTFKEITKGNIQFNQQKQRYQAGQYDLFLHNNR